MKKVILSAALAFLQTLTWNSSLAFGAAEVELTILHTNDLHSHFRGTTYPVVLGGVARLKTEIDQLRATIPYTALVDGGDWSEGSIYYTEGAGIESVEMMEHLGYDFAVVGNHDWLNGPDQLLDSLAASSHRTRFLSANLSIPDSYPRKSEFKQQILPYKIQDYGGFKIAWIGLSTYEFIYDKFFSPIRITNPFTAARNLAHDLKRNQKVDGVVLLSHNSIKSNELILKAANELEGQNDVDLIIGAHDHVRLFKPIEIKRWEGGRAAWIVETGMGGEYLGRVDVKLSQGRLELVDYNLIPMDSHIRENPETLERVRRIENRIESKLGPIFHDTVGESTLDFGKAGIENLMGNFVTDCYRRETGADFSIESNKFIYDTIHPGLIRPVDLFNSVPPVFNPKTGQTWTLRTLPIKGNVLKWLLYLYYGTKKLSAFGLINVSGLKFRYDPLFNSVKFEYDLQNELSGPAGNSFIGIESIPVVQDIEVMKSNSSEFQPLESNATYTMATGGGIIEGIEFVNSSKLGTLISLEGIKDTFRENWRVLLEQVQAISLLTPKSVDLTHRIRTLQGNLGIYPYNIEWSPISRYREGWFGKVRARIENYGDSPTQSGAQVHLFIENERNDQELVKAQTLKSLKPGEFEWMEWEAVIPEIKGHYPVKIQIMGADHEVNLTNHEATAWLNVPISEPALNQIGD